MEVCPFRGLGLSGPLQPGRCGSLWAETREGQSAEPCDLEQRSSQWAPAGAPGCVTICPRSRGKQRRPLPRAPVYVAGPRGLGQHSDMCVLRGFPRPVTAATDWRAHAKEQSTPGGFGARGLGGVLPRSPAPALSGRGVSPISLPRSPQQLWVLAAPARSIRAALMAAGHQHRSPPGHPGPLRPRLRPLALVRLRQEPGPQAWPGSLGTTSHQLALPGLGSSALP